MKCLVCFNDAEWAPLAARLAACLADVISSDPDMPSHEGTMDEADDLLAAFKEASQ